jgi:hypothetical protein
LRDDELIAAIIDRLNVPTGDWVTAYETGDCITCAEAGKIADCSSETARRRCVEADEEGNPLGVRFANTWFVSLKRWLADIEQREGLHARLVAETRAKKSLEIRSTPQLNTRSLAN